MARSHSHLLWKLSISSALSDCSVPGRIPMFRARTAHRHNPKIVNLGTRRPSRLSAHALSKLQFTCIRWNTARSPTLSATSSHKPFFKGSEDTVEPPGSMKRKGMTFPTTDWDRLAQLSSAAAVQRQLTLDFVARRYWTPIYSYMSPVAL